TVACANPFDCSSEAGVPGGIGIEVAAGASSVSISNGAVEDYVYGIVADQAHHLSASNLALTADVGVTLSDVSQSTFKGITYRGADTRYHATAGPLLYVSGGGNNCFSNLSGKTGSGVGVVDAVQIVGSNSVAAGAKLTQGRRLKTDPPRREVVRSGGPHAGGGASGGDPGFEKTGKERPGDRADFGCIAQHGATLFTVRRAAAL